MSISLKACLPFRTSPGRETRTPPVQNTAHKDKRRTAGIGGFRGGAEGGLAPFFSCIFKTFLYDPNPSNCPFSVVIIIQSGFNFIQFQPSLSEFSASAPGREYFSYWFLLLH